MTVYPNTDGFLSFIQVSFFSASYLSNTFASALKEICHEPVTENEIVIYFSGQQRRAFRFATPI